jgi:hypothetical protein
MKSQRQSSPQRSRHRHLSAAPAPEKNFPAKCIEKAHKYAAKVPLSHPKYAPNRNQLLHLKAKSNTHPPVCPPVTPFRHPKRRKSCRPDRPIALKACRNSAMARAKKVC